MILKINVYVQAMPGSRSITEWADLPLDVQELVVSSLPLVHMARASRTCKFFRATFRRLLAKEQQTRCNLAARCFDQRRIDYLIALINRFVKGESLGPFMDINSRFRDYWVSEEGVLHSDASRVCRHIQRARQESAVDITMVADPGGMPFCLQVDIEAGHGSKVSLTVWQEDRCPVPMFSKTGRLVQGAFFTVHPSKDDDLEGVALVQALLGGGVSKSLHDVRQSGHISILGLIAPEFQDPELCFTSAGFKAQILPLLPFGSRCKQVVGDSFYTIIQERMYFGHVASHANKEITSCNDICPLCLHAIEVMTSCNDGCSSAPQKEPLPDYVHDVAWL